MTGAHIILASKSPRRTMLLEQYGYSFQVNPSQADELDATAEDIAEIVVENARIKGREVIPRHQPDAHRDEVLVAADTLVVMGDTVYSKPADLEEAERFMNELGGQEHQVLTGVYLHHFQSGRSRTFTETTGVVLKVMSHQEIQDLFRRVTPLDKAAGYGFQDAPEIVTTLKGSETNVIGLPMEKLAQELTALLDP